MHILDIPKEVISANILPFLRRNDLLRLRRVCNYTKVLADEYIRLYSKSDQFIAFSLSLAEIESSDSKTISAFLEQGGPVAKTSTHFHLKNDVQEDYSETEILHFQNFITIYGSRITHLKMDTLGIKSESLEFLQTMPNLKHLTIMQMFGNDNSQKTLENNFPDVLRNLKSFDIVAYFADPENDAAARDDVRKLWNLFHFCSDKLEYIYHPRITPLLGTDGRRSDPEEPFKTVIEIIEKRERRSATSDSCLKHVDLMGYQEDGAFSSSQAFHRLLSLCSRNNIRIFNVDTLLINGILENAALENGPQLLNNTIVSTKNSTCRMLSLELPLLQTIKILDVPTRRALICEFARRVTLFEGLIWPNLQDLKLVIGKSFIVQGGDVEGEFSETTFPDIFFGMKHEKLEKLDLYFSRDYSALRQTEYKVYRPNVSNIIHSCANLKSLSILSWPGTNKMISQLWGGLPLLEKVELGHCEKLGNVAFVGENLESPVFLKLKRLRHLSLNWLEKSPKITDTLFTLVIRHMPLTHLYLTSNCERSGNNEASSVESYPSVTAAGIRALLTGEFARTIEVFPLRGHMRLQNTTVDQLRQLELEFRCANML